MIRLFTLLFFAATPVFAQTLSPAQTTLMKDAQIIILGEIHDNREHHQGQAKLLALIDPKAVVFEMLSATQAEIVNADLRKDVAKLSERIKWDASGWPDFKLYAPIFAALGDRRVVGAAAPSGVIRDAFGKGAAKVFGEGAARFGLDQDVPSSQLEARKQMQFDAHCETMPITMMGGMVEAQRLRDAFFSRAALNAYEQYGAPIVVITGNGHARRDWGMPALLSKAAPKLKVYSVGFVERPAPSDDPRFNVTIVTAPAERSEPCDAFK